MIPNNVYVTKLTVDGRVIISRYAPQDTFSASLTTIVHLQQGLTPQQGMVLDAAPRISS
jgi:hypothetical protein